MNSNYPYDYLQQQQTDQQQQQQQQQQQLNQQQLQQLLAQKQQQLYGYGAPHVNMNSMDPYGQSSHMAFMNPHHPVGGFNNGAVSVNPYIQPPPPQVPQTYYQPQPPPIVMGGNGLTASPVNSTTPALLGPHGGIGNNMMPTVASTYSLPVQNPSITLPTSPKAAATTTTTTTSTPQQKPLLKFSEDEEEEEEEDEEEEDEEEKESDDYQSESEAEDDEDNDSFIKKKVREDKGTTTETTGRRKASKFSIKFLSDSEEEQEEEEEDSDSDYEPDKKKRGRKPTKKGKAPAVRKSRSKVEEEYERLAAASLSRPTRERRSTVRLYSELTTGSEGDDDGDQEMVGSGDEPESENNSDSDYQSDESDSKPLPTRRSTRYNVNNNFENNDLISPANSEEEDYYSDDDRRKKTRRSSKYDNSSTPNNTITHANLRKRGDIDFSMFNSDQEEEELDEEGNPVYKPIEVETKPVGLVVEAPQDEDTIEKVLDHRIRKINTTESNNNNNGDEKNSTTENSATTEEQENLNDFNVGKYEFLVKWKGWAHIHNTWDTYEHFINFKGNKKLVNYYKTILDMIAWRQEASREDIEQNDIQRELNRQEYQEFLKVERIIATREVEPTPDNKSTTQYLVKWSTLPYSDVTWEYTEDISDKYQNEIDNYLIRTQTQMSTKANSVSAKKRAEMVFTKFEKQPEYLSAGQLRDYQLEGLNWLIHSWFNNTNVILADEMGLGKTIQTISFLSYLNVDQQMPGPFLVVVPLSTIDNWHREFAKWAPQINVIVYTGSSTSRAIIREYEFHHLTKLGKKKINFNVLLTTYDFISKDRSYLMSFKWDFLAVDEAHRLKNNESVLHEVLKSYHTGNRLLVTGTPLQNSLKELWNLLNFLMPNKFHSLKEFQDQYSDLKENDQIAELHRVLKPHLLRRIKKDVEKSLPPKTERILRVDFTPLQKKYYKWILAKNFSELNKGVKGEKTTLLNIVTELKKTCNHPYLFESAIQESPGTLDAMVKGSGKLILLDKLLIRLKETGHRVLIFSQMVRMLDILAEYLKGRSFQFQRLDGSMSNDKRNLAMDRFNAPDSPDFCFLLSTRAGGLGINLTTADTVIIFDSDWNPQNDLQAEARAHRIGQKNQVNIYRLVSKGSIEEDILERAKQKMVLDHLVIQSMEKSPSASKSSSNVFNKDELEKILKFGAEDLFKEGDDESNQMPEMDIDEILARAEPTNPDQQNSGQLTAGQELLNSFRVANFSTGPKEELAWDQIIPDGERQAANEEDKITLLGPRRRTETSTLYNMPSISSHSPLTITVKPKKEITFFNKKEIKVLIRSLKKYGTHKRCKEILADANFPATKPVRATEDICKEIIDACRKAVKENQESDKVHIIYNGTDINAVEMMQKIQDMEVLSDLCQPHINDSSNFKVTFPIRPVSWIVKWGPHEDAMLLMGNYKHGIGNWESIQADTSLELDQIISLSNDPNDPNDPNSANKIKAPTLQRRVDTLLKSARDVYLAKKSLMNQEEQKHLESSKSTTTQSKALSARKRIPKSGISNADTQAKAEKRKLQSMYSDDEDYNVNNDDNDDDDEDYVDKKSSRKKTSRNSSRSKSTSSSSSKQNPKKKVKSSSKPAPSTTIQSPEPKRTSSGRMSVPPQKLTSSGLSSPSTKSSKSKLFSDDENPSKRRTAPSSSSTSSSSSGKSSSNNGEFDDRTMRKCKNLLNPVQNLLDSFEKDLANMEKELKLQKTKQYLMSIGNEIQSIVKSDKSSTKDLEKHLWNYTSDYISGSWQGIKSLYEKMVKPRSNK